MTVQFSFERKSIFLKIIKISIFQSKLSKLLLAPFAVIRNFRDFVGVIDGDGASSAKSAT